ncbi:HAMP domain-containing sensor histidine kinase [Xanthocytophaga flavus]|nr:HAMP domain-containing sensor histidine kinase [Xanthocytophaga flavus]
MKYLYPAFFRSSLLCAFAAVVSTEGMSYPKLSAAQIQERVETLQAESQIQRMYITLLIIVSIILTILVAVVIWSRKNIQGNMHLEIEKKRQELFDIQNQVQQANEELRVINTNLEAIVEERTLKLSKVNRELDMFLYRASHDLRRPITTLMGLVEVSKLGFDEASGRMLFEKINDTAINMDSMLEKFSMINTINHDEYECGEVDFEDVVCQVQQSSIISTYASKIQFDIDIEKNIRLISEPRLITFILKNLIANSVIFHCRTNRQPVVRLTIKQIQDSIAIELYDNGIGISKSMLPEIFHLFYRGSEVSKGNGLGLYVVQKAIEKLNGRIQVESEENQWTSVHIVLPPMEAKTIVLSSTGTTTSSAIA